MVFSIIQKSQLEDKHRMDAEFFHPEKLNAIATLSKQRGKIISDYFISSKKIFNPTSQKLENGAIIYDLTDAIGFFLGDGLRVKSEKEIGSNKRILEKNDVIISRLRSYLKEIAFVFNDGNLKFSSTEFFAFRKKKNINIHPELLFVFLQTSVIQKILEWSQEGVNHPRFSENAILELKLPDALIERQNEIKKLVENGHEAYSNSKSLYQQAENLLLEELGLKNFESENNLFSIVNLSDVKSSHRMDAEYFQGKYKIIEEKIKKYNAIKLGDLASIKKGIEVGANEYQEEGRIFIRVSSMSKNGITESDQKYLTNKLYEKLKNNFAPKKGEILLTKDATPGIAYLLKKNIDGIIAGGILRLKIKNEINDEYLALCLNSIIGQMQAERDAGGSVIAHWKPEQIKNILIPILSKSIQQKISDLVQKSHEARKKAKELLEEAKRKVEEMIEK